MNSNFTHLNSKLRITKLLRSSSGTLRKSALALSLFILFTLFNTNNLLAQCAVVVTQPSVTFTIDLDGGGMATVDGTTPQVSANLSAVSDPPCDTYVFYESDGTTLIGTSISLDCTDEGVQTTYVVRIAEDGVPTNPSIEFLTIHVTPLDNEKPTIDQAPGALDAALECDAVDAYVVSILSVPLITASDNCTPPNPAPVVSLATDSGPVFPGPGMCAQSYIRTLTYTAVDGSGNVSDPYTVVLTVDDNTDPTWATAVGALNATVDCDDAQGLIDAQALVPEAMDNCSDVGDITITEFFAGTFIGGSNPQPIPLAGTGGAPCVGGPTVSVASVTTTGVIGTSAILDHVRINLTHTFDADLDMTLMSPMGTIWELSSDNGGGANDYINTIFQDGAPSITLGAAPFTGVFEAEDGPFATGFDGESILGMWTLSICDDAIIDSGTLLDFEITFLTTTPDPGFVAGCGMTGVYTNHWQAMDECSNTSVIYTQTINVVDNDAPTSTQADITVDALDPPDCNKMVMLELTGANTMDNCDDFADLTITNDGGGLGVGDGFADASGIYPLGTTTVTFSLTDLCGNNSLHLVDVIVEDNNPPVITYADIVHMNNTTAGDCSNIFGWTRPLDGPPDVFDCSGPLTVTETIAGPDPGAIMGAIGAYVPGTMVSALFPVGVTTITYTFTDTEGNMDTRTVTVTITDNEPPVAVCQDITVQLDGSGNASIVAGDIDNGSDDNCGIASMSVVPNTFTCANKGAVAVTLTVTDNSGLMHSCNATVTVEDNVAPIAICKNITVQLDVNGMASISASDINDGSSDNCTLMPTLSIPPTNYTCADIGANNVTLTVTDANGNASICNAVVTVEDNVSPAPVCQNLTVQLDAFGNASITAIQIDNGSSDACGIASLSVAPNSFTCVDVGANIVTLTVTDNNGNVATCNSTVTVQDNVAPVALCQDITVQLDGSNMASIVGGDVDNGSNDACGIASLSVSPNMFDCSNIGSNSVTLTVTDGNGNMSSCMANVTVEDLVPPTLVCPTEAILISDVTTETINGPFGVPDICPSPGFLEETIVVSAPPGASITDLDLSLELTHTWVGDLSAQIESPSGTIISFFHRPGTTSTGVCTSLNGLGCPADNLVATFDDESANPYNDFENSCVPSPPAAYAITGDFMPQSPFSSFDGEDPNGSWIIRIQDNAAADAGTLDWLTLDIEFDYFQVGNDFERDTDAGNCDYTAVGTEFDPTTWDDNCPGSTITHNYPGAPFANTLNGAVFFIGQTVITWTVTDASGNMETCNISIFVTDNELPTQTGGQANGTTIPAVAVGCTAIVNWVEPTFTDNCPPVTVVSNFTPPFSFPVGVTTVVYTATDANNNSTVVSFDIEVTDGTAPIAGCQPIPIDLFLDANGNVTLTALDVNLGSMDNCGNITLLISVLGNPFAPSYTFNCTELGTHIVTLEVSDGLLTDQCTATVNVFDNIFPTAACKDITINLDAFGNASINATQVDNGSTDNGLLCLSLGIDISSFNCNDIGPNTVTLTATDAASNTDQCTATVTVEDNIPPNLFGIPADVTISCLNPIPNPPVIGPGGVTANDNCDTPVIIFNETSTKSGNPNNCLNYSYVITRTWTASDNSSNTTMQSQTLTIVDNSAPTNASYNASVSNGATISTNPNDCFATVTLEMTGLNDCAPFANLTITNDAPFGNGMTSANGNYPIGSYTINFTATDPCGNTSMFSYSFSVEDGVAPVASCVNNLNLGLPSSGTLILSPGAVNNGSYDNCNGTSGIASISVSPNVFDCDDIGGPHSVTLTVTDFAGNTSTCNTTINIQENNDPIPFCQNISVTLDGNGMVTITPDQIDNGSFDDCTAQNDLVLSLSQTTFDESDLGNNLVFLTVTDEQGNSDSCPALVTVGLPPTCFDIGSVAGGAGNIVSIPVTAEDFTGVVGFQFQVQIMSDADSINWDSVGEFVSISGIHPDLSNQMIFTLLADTLYTPIDTTYLDEVDGMGNPIYPPLDSIDMIFYDTTLFYNNASVSWQQFNPAGPISVSDGTILFYIDVLLTGNLNDFSVIKIVNPSIQTPPEITYDFNNQLFNLVPCWFNGQIYIGELIIAGNIQTENGDNVALADVTLRNANTNAFIASQTTALDGNFSFTVVNGGSFDIDPSKNINWSNGIDILDVASIQRHAVNFAFVNSAYKKIAADVNGNNSITTFDAVQLNQFLSSGFNPAFTPPNSPSWRFADAMQVLPNLPNATVPPYNDELTILNIISDTLMNDFIGIKMGDIAGLMADPTTLTGGGAEELSDTDLKFLIDNKTIKENESFSIDLKSENFDRLIGYQWTLQFDSEALRYQGYEQGSLVNLGDGNFGELMVDEGKLILTWYHAFPTDIETKDVLFTLNFESTRDIEKLSDVLSLGELIQITPIAYNDDEDPRDIELVFVDIKKVEGEFALYQNIPNPFIDETLISFNLPKKTHATLIITDIAGRILKKVEGDFEKGYNEINLNRGDLPQSGTLFYELTTPDNTATKQMIIIE